MSNKDYKQFSDAVIPLLLKAGWVETTQQNYRKFKSPKTNQTISFSHTPSDQNAYRQTFRNIRRNDPELAQVIKDLGLY